MHRIDGPTAAPGGLWTEGDPVGGVPATIVSDDWMNDTQENLIAILTAAGIAPIKGDYTQLVSAIRSVSGGTLNKKRSARAALATAGSSLTITDDEVTVKTALGGASYILPAFSQVINVATTGAGGMNAGAAPVSGYVATYAIYDPVANTRALYAVNASAGVAPEICGVAMPAGFTASALMAVWPTNASSLLVAGFVRGRTMNRNDVIVLNTTTAVASLTTLSIAAAAPFNAISIGGSLNVTSSAGSNNSAIVAADATGFGQQYVSQGPGTGMSGNFTLDLLTAQTMFWNMNTTGTTLSLVIRISSYEF